MHTAHHPTRHGFAALALLCAGAYAAAPAPIVPWDPLTKVQETPAEHAVARARRALLQGSTSAEEHTALAVALSKRARETADPLWYDRSDAQLKASLERSPDNFAARRHQVWNQLGRHEFAAALEGALALHERAKDDVLTYGLLVDAHVELGHYAKAEDAAQWMLNLRPGAPAALTRVSYLREQFGDVGGAVQVMDMAFHSTRPSDVEDRAWILTHLAHLESERGRSERAANYALNALRLFPDYHYALAELARARAETGNLERAQELLEKRYAVAPHPENLFELAVCREARGHAEAAASMFEAFEASALEESPNTDNANLQLIEYWLEHSERPGDGARALELALTRAGERQDIGTLAALAWAQHRTGQPAEARQTMERVLAVGTRNPKIRYRAGVIGLAAGDVQWAREQWEQTLQDAPRCPEGRLALAALKRLDP